MRWRRSRKGGTEAEDKDQDKMESREGGNVLLQFILEEPHSPQLPDSYQLPPSEMESHGGRERGGGGQIEGGLVV